MQALNVVIVVLLVVGVIVLLTYVLRLRRLLSRRGSFQVSVIERDAEKWHRGVAVFGRYSLDWYPTKSLHRKPKFSWLREDIRLDVSGTSDPDLQVVVLSTPHGDWKVATDSIAVSAIVSWLDSAPPVAEPTD